MRITVITSLYNCERHLSRFFGAVERMTNPDEVELLLLHNEPTAAEIAVVTASLARLSHIRIRHIPIPRRESLYATWNRGVALAQGVYTGVWNVDDIRQPDSLERQARALDLHPDAALAYGDIIGIRKPDDREGVHYTSPDWEQHKSRFLRRFYISCFPMWRKSIHETVGYFDEQFRIVGDFDFQIRVARRFPLVRTPGVLGYYLEGDAAKLSSAYAAMETERTLVELRYGQMDKLNLLFLPAALRQFNAGTLFWHDGATRITEVFPRYRGFIASRLMLTPLSLLRLPRFALRHAKRVLTGRTG